MSFLKKEIFYKETLYCPWSILVVVSLVLTAAVDLLNFIFWGRPPMTANAMLWVLLFSAGVFLMAFIYSCIRYRVKIKMFRSVIDGRDYWSLCGVGKGTWLQVANDAIISCEPTVYSMPLKYFFVLLTTSNVPFQYGNAPYPVYPLPGWKGTGILMAYRQDSNTGQTVRKLLIPTRKPDDVWKWMMRKKAE